MLIYFVMMTYFIMTKQYKNYCKFCNTKQKSASYRLKKGGKERGKVVYFSLRSKETKPRSHMKNCQCVRTNLRSGIYKCVTLF